VQATFFDLYAPNFIMIPSDCSGRRYRDKHVQSQLPGIAMKRLIAVVIALAALTGPLHAQASMKKSGEKSSLQIEEEQKKKEAERIDQEYKAAIKRSQGAAAEKTVTDPWQNMRGADDSKNKR
jgi:hypothetical protein